MTRINHLRFMLPALAAAAILGACGVKTPPTPAPGPAAIQLLPPGPTRVAGVCIDSTGSVGGALTPVAQTLLRNNINAFVSAPHSSSLHLYVRTLTHDSWAPKNVVLTGGIRPVSPERPEPVKKPFESYAKYQGDLNAWRRERELIVTQRHAARADADALLAKVAAIKLPITRSGSDVAGCFAKFGDLEPDQSGPRSLIVLSDLERAGYQTAVPVRLANTSVTVVFWCGARHHTGSKCDGEKERWTRTLLAGGATSVRFHDSSSVPFITDIFR